jgi:hypothetical protein
MRTAEAVCVVVRQTFQRRHIAAQAEAHRVHEEATHYTRAVGDAIRKVFRFGVERMRADSQALAERMTARHRMCFSSRVRLSM